MALVNFIHLLSLAWVVNTSNPRAPVSYYVSQGVCHCVVVSTVLPCWYNLSALEYPITSTMIHLPLSTTATFNNAKTCRPQLCFSLVEVPYPRCEGTSFAVKCDVSVKLEVWSLSHLQMCQKNHPFHFCDYSVKCWSVFSRTYQFHCNVVCLFLVCRTLWCEYDECSCSTEGKMDHRWGNGVLQSWEVIPAW